MAILTTDEIRTKINTILEHEPDKYKRWLAIATTKIDFYSIGTKSISNVKPAEIVNELLTRLYIGKREYDDQKYPDFDYYMHISIASVTDNFLYHANQDKKRFVELADEEDQGVENETQKGLVLENIAGSRSDDPLERVICSEFRDACFSALEDEPESYFVFEKILEGHTIESAAKELGMTANQVTHYRRKVFRMLKGIKEEYLI